MNQDAADVPSHHATSTQSNADSTSIAHRHEEEDTHGQDHTFATIDNVQTQIQTTNHEASIQTSLQSNLDSAKNHSQHEPTLDLGNNMILQPLSVEAVHQDIFLNIAPRRRSTSIHTTHNLQPDEEDDIEEEVDAPPPMSTTTHHSLLEEEDVEQIVPPVPPPQTAREQLIERERQARLERERARLKRQLALSREREEEDQRFKDADIARVNSDDSIANTSIRALEINIDHEHEENGQRGNEDQDAEQEDAALQRANAASPFGFTMERFLQENIENTIGDDVENGMAIAQRETHNVREHTDANHLEIDSYRVADEIVPTDSDSIRAHIIHEDLETHEQNSHLSSPVRMGNIHHDDIENEGNDIYDIHRDTGLSRLAQLAEATTLDIDEIDYASVGVYAPRSVRDERHLPDLAGMSNASFDHTQTTMNESETSVGLHSVQSQISDHGSMTVKTSSSEKETHADDGALNQVSPLSNVAKLPMQNFIAQSSTNSVVTNRSDASILATSVESDRKMPAIEKVEDIPMQVPSLNNFSNDSEEKWSEAMEFHQSIKSDDLPPNAFVHTITATFSPDGNTSADLYDIPNRTIRPGMIKIKSDSSRAKLHRRSQTTPVFPSFVDDFDYCKYDSNDNPVSIEQQRGFFPDGTQINESIVIVRQESKSYGACDDEEKQCLISSKNNDTGPEESNEDRRFNFDSMVDSVFSSVRSMSTADFQAEINDCDKYSSSPVIVRAFSERFLPLIITLIIEIPVLLMITGGSDNLVQLIGQRRYELLIAILPISTALSGNCGLQASALSTRAISHLHVTKENYLIWLLQEIQVSAILGIGIGGIIGILSYHLSGHDAIFSLVMFLANAIGLTTSGFIGTLGPLVFSFIFHRESGKWSSLIATSCQDIIGCCAMIVFSYHALKFFGKYEGVPSEL
ncbi:hypothetical protein CTEN210_00373 [Chaetoceros tenuissimus]|uniref:SLC41A/MgtE integral membrane domain-containing protein n=1 Tax=Chaetoceros tenuissimus TaxID=426638 RepID=A0AAD3CF21_9STRA|nr:hypothetical protein CTEN210_00373 [Chaetoceros tenuissimus]